MTERIQKVLAHLGLASRREAEVWIRAGRVSINGRVAQLGDRVAAGEVLQLDGRAIRQRAANHEPVLLCHRSPGLRLLPADDADDSFAAHLPRRSGRRFISVSPLPQIDGGLELLTADGDLAARLQRSVRGLPMEFSLRVRGQIEEPQQAALLAGQLDSGVRLQVQSVEPAGGEGANRWYTLKALGVSGNDLRQLIERSGITASRILRTALGTLHLERTLARGRSRELTDEELKLLLNPPAAALGATLSRDDPGAAISSLAARKVAVRSAAAGRSATGPTRRGSPGPAARGKRSPGSRGQRSR